MNVLKKKTETTEREKDRKEDENKTKNFKIEKRKR